MNRDQWEYLKADSGGAAARCSRGIRPVGVAVMTFRRTTTTEVELRGEMLPPGEKVVMFYPSGNRDELAFEDPWKFDVTRSPNHHLGFGGGGPHYCMGASLARTQLTRSSARCSSRSRTSRRVSRSCFAVRSSTASSGCRARSRHEREYRDRLLRASTPTSRRSSGFIRLEHSVTAESHLAGPR